MNSSDSPQLWLGEFCIWSCVKPDNYPGCIVGNVGFNKEEECADQTELRSHQN